MRSVADSVEVNGLIARRLAVLRRTKGLSFDALAARSAISKGMLVAIEKGQANPSIGTLCKLAASVGTSLAELLSEQAQATSSVQIVASDKTNVLWRGTMGGRAVLVVGSAGPDMLELWKWTLFPGERFQSKGHPPRTIELLSVEEGILGLDVDGVDHVISTGHRAIAKTDKPHAYRCHGKKRTRFSMVVHEPAST